MVQCRDVRVWPGQGHWTCHRSGHCTGYWNGHCTGHFSFSIYFRQLHTSTPPLLPNITAVLCWAQLGHSLLHCFTATQNEIYKFKSDSNFLREIRPESIPANRVHRVQWSDGLCFLLRLIKSGSTEDGWVTGGENWWIDGPDYFMNLPILKIMSNLFV